MSANERIPELRYPRNGLSNILIMCRWTTTTTTTVDFWRTAEALELCRNIIYSDHGNKRTKSTSLRGRKTDMVNNDNRYNYIRIKYLQ